VRKRQDLYNKSRVMGDYQARFCERLGLKCPCLLDAGRYSEGLRDLTTDTDRKRKRPFLSCWQILVKLSVDPLEATKNRHLRMSGFAAARLATSDGPDRRRIQRYSMDLSA